MNPEKPNQPTPEEIAEMEKSRTISDAELLEDGAEYVVDEEGEKILHTTDEQKKKLHGIIEFSPKKEKYYKYINKDEVEEYVRKKEAGVDVNWKLITDNIEKRAKDSGGYRLN